MPEKIGVCKINIALRKVRNGLFIFDFFNYLQYKKLKTCIFQ